jgi:hypothetical protein
MLPLFLFFAELKNLVFKKTEFNLNRKKWELVSVELIPSPLSKAKRRLLLAELAQLIYFDICQLHESRSFSIDSESNTVHETAKRRTGSDD